MINNGKKSLADIMSELQSEGQVSIPLLYQLSDLTPAELGDFCSSWSEIDPARRRVIVRHLADITEENYQVDFTGIFEHCLDDMTPEVRKASLDGLWDNERLTLIDRLIRLMQSDPDTEVRAHAAATLGHYILLGEWRQMPADSVEPAVEALLEQIDDDSAADAVRRASLESVAASGHPRVDSLIMDAYDSGELAEQLSALFAMGRSADPRWINIVIGEMSSPLVEMRLEAARAAGEISHKSALSELIELTADEDYEVRLVAVSALGRIGGDVARGVLTDMADDPDMAELSEAASEALEELDWLGGEFDLSMINRQD